MMRLVMLTLGLCIGLISLGQRNMIYWPIDNETEKINFKETIYLPNTTTPKVFSSAKQYVEKTFASQMDSVLMVDDQANTIICKGVYLTAVDLLGERGKGYISYIFSVRCINNSYKYSFTDFEHFSFAPKGAVGGPLEGDVAVSGGASFPRLYWNKVKAETYYTLQVKIEQLKEWMKKHAQENVPG